MTKSKIKQELKGMWNNTKVVAGANIARVCWKDRTGQWMVIENDETFEDAVGDNFQCITSFKTQDELVDVLFRTL